MIGKTSKVTIRILAILSTVQLMLIACSATDEKSESSRQSTHSLTSTTYIDSLPELTPEQQSSFDALNTLQISTDEKNQLYSTFASVVQPCYPPDTIFSISRSELLTAMEQFVVKHCTNLSGEKRKELVLTAVLAQEEYTILHCSDNSSDTNYGNGLPMTGIWVIPGILGRRNVILIW